MRQHVCQVGPLYLPIVSVRFRRTTDDEWSEARGGLVDTGASYTLATTAVAAFLGIPDSELVKARTVTYEGVGGAIEHAHEIKLDLLVGVLDRKQSLTLGAVRVWFTKGKLPYPLLLGQHDVLTRLQLVHKAQLPTPELVLKEPF
jgi:predicted aspartyl protease